MRTPDKTLAFRKNDYVAMLEQYCFEKHGDKYEQAHHAFAKEQFPQHELFWRHFVVPLTNRLDRESPDEQIHFRGGVDERLQYIGGASYSLFGHLSTAKEILRHWSDASMDAVYARLASAFDVFEGVSIQLYLLLCESRGVKSKLVDELPLETFLEMAEEHYKKHYQNLHQYYVTIGKRVPAINIPTGEAVFNEFFDGHKYRKEYLTISNYIRSLRNAIVHDVRVGMLRTDAGEHLIPKASRVQDYRQWAKVIAVRNDSAKVSADFCEVEAQCKEHLDEVTRLINELYGHMVTAFRDEFYTGERDTLRKLFGTKFDEGSSELLAAPLSADTPESHSFAASRKPQPAPKDAGGSGIYLAPTNPKNFQ